MEISGKKFSIIVFSLVAFALVMSCLLVYIVDPYFHYHKPYSKISYILDDERYQNDGIVKHFDYDAIITGTSMTENFKTSEFDSLFDVNSIKVAYAGAMFKEINDNLAVALNYNKDVKMIIRCLDLYKINEPKDNMAYDIKTYPLYMYDDNLINDVNYVFNKNVVISSLLSVLHSIRGEESTSFDEYASWQQYYKFSKKTVDSGYKRVDKNSVYTLSENDYKNIMENISQNVTDLADQYPNVQFYLFYPPYSIYFWDNANQLGNLNMILDMIEYATELILEHKNIYLYSFINEFDIVTNLNNYRDERHYSEKINSLMLKYMYDDKDLLTIDNYKEKMKEAREFYSKYDYDALFE